MMDDYLTPDFYEYVRSLFLETPTYDNSTLIASYSDDKLAEIGRKQFEKEELFNPANQIITHNKELGKDDLLPYKFQKAKFFEFRPLITNVDGLQSRNPAERIEWASSTTRSHISHIKSVLLLSHRITLTSPLPELRFLAGENNLPESVKLHLRNTLTNFLNVIYYLEPLIKEGIVRFIPSQLTSQEMSLKVLEANLEPHKRRLKRLLEFTEKTNFTLHEDFIRSGRNYLDKSQVVSFNSGLPLSSPYESHYINDTYSQFLTQSYHLEAIDCSFMSDQVYWIEMLKQIILMKSATRRTIPVPTKEETTFDALRSLMEIPVPNTENLSFDDLINIRLNDSAFETYREALEESLLDSPNFEDDPVAALKYIRNRLNHGKETLEKEMKKVGFLRTLIGDKFTALFNIGFDVSVGGGLKTLAKAGQNVSDYISEADNRKANEALLRHYVIWTDT